MSDQFSRTAMLIGDEGIKRLKNSRVAIFGIGGVGSYTLEALVRSGVGVIDIIDNDTVCETNINRQLIAAHSTLGRAKVDAARDRALDINPDAVIHVHKVFYLPETAEQFDFSQYDYIVDAIDTVSGKLQLIEEAERKGVPIISSMGAGNKLDPTLFKVSDIYKTSVCPLARVIRNECRKRGIKKLKVVYSTEQAITPRECDEELAKGKRQTAGSVAFVPSVAGLIIAGEVIKDIIGM